MVSTDLDEADIKMKPIEEGACLGGIPLGDLFAVWQSLMAFDSMPDAELLQKSARDPVASLLFLSEREDITPSIRMRAFEALSLVPDGRVEAAYTRILNDPSAEKLRHAAINGYARAWPDKSPEVLGALLSGDEDPQIRLTAASALTAFGGEEGLKLVKAQAEVEPEEWVRKKMKGYAKPSKAGFIP